MVLDITGGDEDTVRAVMAALEECWATSGVGPVSRDPGEPGVRARSKGGYGGWCCDRRWSRCWRRQPRESEAQPWRSVGPQG
ncbi:DUF6207 family protein [Streptomyces sp. NPDC054854]